MANGIVITKTEYDLLLQKVSRLEKTVSLLMARLEDLFDKEPKYGTDKWWEWSDKKALQDIKAGRYTTIRNEEDLDAFFKNL